MFCYRTNRKFCRWFSGIWWAPINICRNIFWFDQKNLGRIFLLAGLSTVLWIFLQHFFCFPELSCTSKTSVGFSLGPDSTRTSPGNPERNQSPEFRPRHWRQWWKWRWRRRPNLKRHTLMLKRHYGLFPDVISPTIDSLTGPSPTIYSFPDQYIEM